VWFDAEEAGEGLGEPRAVVGVGDERARWSGWEMRRTGNGRGTCAARARGSRRGGRR
jgi:hypothetical protein